MATSVKSNVKTRNPTVTDDSLLNDRIALATEETRGDYGEKLNQAIALLVLHWYALDATNPSGTGAVIKREKEGDLEVEYDGLKVSGTQDLQLTRWGQALLALRRGCFMGMRNRMVGDKGQHTLFGILGGNF